MMSIRWTFLSHWVLGQTITTFTAKIRQVVWVLSLQSKGMSRCFRVEDISHGHKKERSTLFLVMSRDSSCRGICFEPSSGDRTCHSLSYRLCKRNRMICWQWNPCLRRIILYSCTPLHIFNVGFVIAHRDRDEVPEAYVMLFFLGCMPEIHVYGR